MDDTLLFLHILSAFALVASIVILSAAVIGVPMGRGPFSVANRMVEIAATATLIFGVWIVLREDAYGIGDGWILGAIGLWVLSVATGTMAGRGVSTEGDPSFDGRAKLLHWLAAAATVGILVLMIWKPGV